MYSIIIRGNIDSDDVEISENSNEKFQEKIEKLISSIPIKLIPNNNSHLGKPSLKKKQMLHLGRAPPLL